MNLADLRKPFPPERISWRVGSTTKDKSKGMALAYIDSRDVQDRLDEVCGPENWQSRYPHANGKTVCEIGIRLSHGTPGQHDHFVEWVWKADGAGDTDVEAEKGALSDAFKRAAVRWGIGRYLYDLESPWVELDTYEKGGQVFAKGIKSAELARLRALLMPKTARTPFKDDDGQLANTIAAYKVQLSNCETQEDVQQWVELREVDLKRIKKASLEAYNDLRNFKEQRIKEIIEESKAA